MLIRQGTALIRSQNEPDVCPESFTQRMLYELIDRIEVHQAEKVDGVHVQRLTIHYSCVGSIEIPDVLPLPEPEVLLQTRKGVAVSYSAQKAV